LFDLEDMAIRRCAQFSAEGELWSSPSSIFFWRHIDRNGTTSLQLQVCRSDHHPTSRDVSERIRSKDTIANCAEVLISNLLNYEAVGSELRGFVLHPIYDCIHFCLLAEWRTACIIGTD